MIKNLIIILTLLASSFSFAENQNEKRAKAMSDILQSSYMKGHLKESKGVFTGIEYSHSNLFGEGDWYVAKFTTYSGLNELECSVTANASEYRGEDPEYKGQNFITYGSKSCKDVVKSSKKEVVCQNPSSTGCRDSITRSDETAEVSKADKCESEASL